MHFSRVVFSALVLLSKFESSWAKAIIYRPSNILSTSNHPNDILPRGPSPQQSSAPTVAGTSVTDACGQAVLAIKPSSNPAGVVACYDVTEWKPATGDFISEVRIYQRSQPSGSWASINTSTALTTLKYPAATIASFGRRMRQRQTTSKPAAIFSTSYTGHIDSTLQLTKLNNTELISLLIPTITLEAISPSSSSSSSNTPVFANISNSDIVFFPTGPFSRTQHSTLSAVFSNPSALAADAISSSTVFVLPGVRLGIFPTGLIITGVWCVLFLGAFGYGTVGRIVHQKRFRRRIANPRFGWL